MDDHPQDQARNHRDNNELVAKREKGGKDRLGMRWKVSQRQKSVRIPGLGDSKQTKTKTQFEKANLRESADCQGPSKLDTDPGIW